MEAIAKETKEANAIFDSIIEDVVQEAYKFSSNSEEVLEKCKDLASIKLGSARLTTEDMQECLETLETELTEALQNADYVFCDLTGSMMHIDHTFTIHYGYRGDTATIADRFETYECGFCCNMFLERAPPEHRNFVTRSHDTNDSGTVCNSCYETHFSTCEDCAAILNQDDMNFNDNGGYCNECFVPGLDCITNNVILPRAATSSQDSLAVGWEIEFYPGDGAELPSSQHVNQVYQDGSLSSEGRELTTQPALPDQWQARLNAIDCAINGGHINTDCGGHLHVDARYLHSLLWGNPPRVNINQLRSEINSLDNAYVSLRQIDSVYRGTELMEATSAIIAALDHRRSTLVNHVEPTNYLNQIHGAIVFYQNALRLLCEEYRNNSDYCRPQKFINVSFDKYMAVNLAGLHKDAERKTIEFRLWEGSIDDADLYRRAEVCEAIVRKLTQAVEWLKSENDIDRQKGVQFLETKKGDMLITQDGFWELYNDGQCSFDTLRLVAKELGLSDAWIAWARSKVVARDPDVPLAA